MRKLMKKSAVNLEPLLQQREKGELDDWKQSAEGSMAFIILLDQFSRNVFRGTAEAFAQDKLALETCLDGRAQGIHKKLHLIHQRFFFMPLEHSEDIEMQRLSVLCFEELAKQAPTELKEHLEGAVKYAVQHFKIVERFGRFPHRNKVLGRVNTAEENDFLKDGPRFGQ